MADLSSGLDLGALSIVERAYKTIVSIEIKWGDLVDFGLKKSLDSILRKNLFFKLFLKLSHHIVLFYIKVFNIL